MALQEVAQKAADYGINYGLEVVNRYETNILNTSYQVSLLWHPGKVPPMRCPSLSAYGD